MTKREKLIADFTKALQRLKEVLQQPSSTIVRDSAIQRFEFCVELSWKLLKECLREEAGIVATGPKDVLRKSFAANLIDYDDLWLTMIDLRNITSYTYHEELAEEVFNEIPSFIPLYEQLLKRFPA